MALIQVNVDDNLKKAIQAKAEMYDVPATSLIRIVLVNSFMKEAGGRQEAGNIFNADRDNRGKAIKIDDLIDAL